jgi:hypothetical protein
MGYGLLGICLYGIVMAVVTLVAVFSGRWSKGVIIALVVLWIPLLVFGVLVFASIGTMQGGGNVFGFLLAWLVVAAPIILIIVLILVVMKLMSNWRG